MMMLQRATLVVAKLVRVQELLTHVSVTTGSKHVCCVRPEYHN